MKKVAVIMGSPRDSDKMSGAAEVLAELGITCDVFVMSAHRSPALVGSFAATARERGYAAIIAGAGMAAHLAGAVAAQCTLPVIGVPLSGSALNGVDALYATVQMPPGMPVATVAIDGSRNAGLLAAQIIGVEDASISAKLNAARDSAIPSESHDAAQRLEIDRLR